jgi:hypothetical protein
LCGLPESIEKDRNPSNLTTNLFSFFFFFLHYSRMPGLFKHEIFK